MADKPSYFSYGAAMEARFWSVFRLSHRILEQLEGPNDGLVSVASSRWGGDRGYKGTLMGVSHLDLINWSNRLKWLAGEITGNRSKYVMPEAVFAVLVRSFGPIRTHPDREADSLDLQVQCHCILPGHGRYVFEFRACAYRPHLQRATDSIFLIADMLAKEGM